MERTERRFLVTILEEDVGERYKEDLQGYVGMAITEALAIEIDVSFGVEEVD
jgi:hypothetical protein